MRRAASVAFRCFTRRRTQPTTRSLRVEASAVKVLSAVAPPAVGVRLPLAAEKLVSAVFVFLSLSTPQVEGAEVEESID